MIHGLPLPGDHRCRGRSGKETGETGETGERAEDPETQMTQMVADVTDENPEPVALSNGSPWEISSGFVLSNPQ